VGAKKMLKEFLVKLWYRSELRASASGLLTFLVRWFYPLNHLFVHFDVFSNIRYDF